MRLECCASICLAASHRPPVHRVQAQAQRAARLGYACETRSGLMTAVAPSAKLQPTHARGEEEEDAWEHIPDGLGLDLRSAWRWCEVVATGDHYHYHLCMWSAKLSFGCVSV